MRWIRVGECKICGAGIYTQNPWFGVTPPPEKRTCNCFGNEVEKIYDINITRDNTENKIYRYKRKGRGKDPIVRLMVT